MIVGAGYTGLWTAYALMQADPTLRIVVCERETVGFGASGRNGGWCSALFAGSRDATARAHGRDAVVAMQRAMFDDARRDRARRRRGAASNATGRAAARSRWRHCPRTSPGSRRSSTTIGQWGFGAGRLPRAVAGRVECADRLPAQSRRPRSLRTARRSIRPSWCTVSARAVERTGVTIYEHTPALAIEPGRVRTPRGTVRAEVVVRATEAFSAELPGLERAVAPVYSLMIATEPLPEAFWAEARLDTRPDLRRLPPHDHLRAAHRRRPFRVRWSRYAVPLRLAGAPGVRPRPARVRRAARDLAFTVPRAGRCRDHTPLGWRGRGAARLVSVGRLRSRRGHRVGGRLCRRRREHDESRGPHDRRSRTRTATPISCGLPWVGHRSRELGAGAVAVVGCQRVAANSSSPSTAPKPPAATPRSAPASPSSSSANPRVMRTGVTVASNRCHSHASSNFWLNRSRAWGGAGVRRVRRSGRAVGRRSSAWWARGTARCGSRRR